MLDANEQAEAGLNDAAKKVQVYELASADASTVKAERQARRVTPDETVSVTYKILDRIALPSRSDPQLVTLPTHSLKAEYYNAATPVLSKAVCNEASLINDTCTVLLAGPLFCEKEAGVAGNGSSQSP